MEREFYRSDCHNWTRMNIFVRTTSKLLICERIVISQFIKKTVKKFSIYPESCSPSLHVFYLPTACNSLKKKLKLIGFCILETAVICTYWYVFRISLKRARGYVYAMRPGRKNSFGTFICKSIQWMWMETTTAVPFDCMEIRATWTFC